ncbi:MAG: tRNA (guanine-N1)-methyltransferase [delta proteobacterium ML8_F1]|nr:MAG: tRNA (guanine-N1)-methyltransferase [delta proteobacterium ML8_F1]
MNIKILTLFPEVITAYTRASIVGRAQDKGLVAIEAINFRDFALNRHGSVDDAPFGGGKGMVLTPEPLARAIREIREKELVVYLSPKGRPLTQEMAMTLSRETGLIMVCGHYEGVDERFISTYVDLEISIGDYVLSGGELGALVLTDAITRLIPGVLSEGSLEEESFTRYLLEYPQYTRPRIFEGQPVPEVLLSGNHRHIEDFRLEAAIRQTLLKRPDLIEEGIAKEVFDSKTLDLITRLKKTL